MRKLLVVAVAGGLILATFPSAALAGDPHAVRNRWVGVGIGAAAVTLGSLLLTGLQGPVYAAPPPVVYAPPPVVVAPPPAVVYAPPVVYAAPPPVLYAPAPVVVYRGWGPPGPWRYHGHGRWARR